MSRFFVFFLLIVLAFSSVMFAQGLPDDDDDLDQVVINFNSDKNVGHPPLLVNFYGHCKIYDDIPEELDIFWDTMYNGNKAAYRGVEGLNVWFQYIKAGHFNVYKGIMGSSVGIAKSRFIDIYEPNGYAPLEFVEGSESHIKYPWTNLVDADTYCWDGVTLTTREAIGTNPFAVFKFVDGETKTVNKFRVKTDAGVDRSDLWIGSVKVYVAADAENPVFSQVLAANISGGDWNEFEVSPAVEAALVKFEIADSRDGEFMVTEFEAYEDIPIPSQELSTLTVTTPHFADDEDAAMLTLILKDANGDPITSYNENDIKFYVNYQHGNFGPLNMIKAGEGIYSIQLKCNIPGSYQVLAVAHGAIILNDIIGDDRTSTIVDFYGFAGQVGELQFVEGSPTSKSQGWDNLTDGDLEGWGGTVTASGNPAYAIFDFPRGIRMPINKIYLKTDNGTADDKYHYRQYNTIQILYSNDMQNWNNLLTVKQRVENYKYFKVPQVFAKYIKVLISADEQRRDDWKQIVELQVQFDSHNGFGYADEEESVKEVTDYNLAAAYPNPFNPSTTIQFAIPKEEHVQIFLYNARGQLVNMLINQQLNAGKHYITWDASAQSSGIYFYKMVAGEFTRTRRILLLK